RTSAAALVAPLPSNSSATNVSFRARPNCAVSVGEYPCCVRLRDSSSRKRRTAVKALPSTESAPDASASLRSVTNSSPCLRRSPEFSIPRPTPDWAVTHSSIICWRCSFSMCESREARFLSGLASRAVRVGSDIGIPCRAERHAAAGSSAIRAISAPVAERRLVLARFGPPAGSAGSHDPYARALELGVNPFVRRGINRSCELPKHGRVEAGLDGILCGPLHAVVASKATQHHLLHPPFAQVPGKPCRRAFAIRVPVVPES